MVSSEHAKNTLKRHLDDARQAMLWKLEGLSEYDIRRPLTAHGRCGECGLGEVNSGRRGYGRAPSVDWCRTSRRD